VRDVLAKEGIDDKTRKAFIVYLLSHDRPMAEVLSPQRLDISVEYKRGFEGMVDEPVTLDELLKAREDLIAEIVGKMPEQHKLFLISVKRGEPDWALFDLPGAKHLPAVQWKLQNLAKLSAEKRAQLLKGLNAALQMKQ
jgi:hypothetical protein